MAKKIRGFNWKDKVGNTAQIGGIETSVLDNGLGRGNRIAWVNTGAGLRYKVVIDRAMDIVDAFQNEYNHSSPRLASGRGAVTPAWLSHARL